MIQYTIDVIWFVKLKTNALFLTCCCTIILYYAAGVWEGLLAFGPRPPRDLWRNREKSLASLPVVFPLNPVGPTFVCVEP